MIAASRWDARRNRVRGEPPAPTPKLVRAVCDCCCVEVWLVSPTAIGKPCWGCKGELRLIAVP